MNPKDYEPSGFHMIEPEKEEPKSKPRYEEGMTLFGTRADGTEFEGTASSISEFIEGDDRWMYCLQRFENWNTVSEWFDEKHVSRLPLAERIRFIEERLGIEH